MADRASADRACKDPNPIIDGRKANVNLAYLGAKPRVIQPGKGGGPHAEHSPRRWTQSIRAQNLDPALLPGFAFGVPQIHPAFIQRPYGYAQPHTHFSPLSHSFVSYDLYVHTVLVFFIYFFLNVSLVIASTC